MFRENWKGAKLLKWGMWWHSVKRFKWPPKITRITIWGRHREGVDVLVYYKVKKCIYYTPLFCTTAEKPFREVSKKFLKRIEDKQTFFRKDFRA